jgi:hypothetical protein
MEPCSTARLDVQMLNSIFAAVAAMLSLWLAHRRNAADKERSRFYSEMRDKHEISACEGWKDPKHGENRNGL